MKRIALILLLVSLLFGVGTGLAVDGYDLSWNVLSSGGGPMEDAGYSLNGTLGQASVGVRTAPDYQLCSGYWCQGITEPFFQVFLPLSSR
jgi:hypothetical protein